MVGQERRINETFSSIMLDGPETDLRTRDAHAEGARTILRIVAKQLGVWWEADMDDSKMFRAVSDRIQSLLASKDRETLKALVRTALELGGKKPQDLTPYERMELDTVAKDRELVHKDFKASRL